MEETRLIFCIQNVYLLFKRNYLYFIYHLRMYELMRLDDVKTVVNFRLPHIGETPVSFII